MVRYAVAPPSNRQGLAYLDTELRKIQSALRNIDADSLLLTTGVIDSPNGVALYFNGEERVRTYLDGLKMTRADRVFFDMISTADTAARIRMGNTQGGAQFFLGTSGSTAPGGMHIQQSAAQSGGVLGASEDLWITGARNGAVALYYNGVESLKTTDRSANGVQTGAAVLDKSGAYQPVGFAIWPSVDSPSNLTLSAAHVGCHIHMSTTPHSLTTPGSTDTDWPIGGWCTVGVGSAAAASTVVAGSGINLVWFTGAATTIATPRTLATGARVTIYRRNASAFDIYGLGIS